jgi:hypothetical protein
VAGIEQEFVGGENPRVHVDDLQRVQVDILAFASDKGIETKTVRA